MVENDPYIYHLKKKPSINQTHDDRWLITQERTRKLDLLLHLIDNLSQSLVICGPEGIGKTRLLKILQKHSSESCHYYALQGNPDLSLERFLEDITQFVKEVHLGKSFQSLTIALAQIKNQGKKIVLMIDDAGFLVPGLITGIIRFAAENPVLRVVFVLTHDDLYVKNQSDSAIDDCLFVEIPPLTEKECGEFLQYLSTKSSAKLAFNAINEPMIESIYRETHGIPGKIIAEVQGFASVKRVDNTVWILIIAIAALVALALGLQWFSSLNKEISPTTLNQQKDVAEALVKSLLEAPIVPQIGQVSAPGAESLTELSNKPIEHEQPPNSEVEQLPGVSGKNAANQFEHKPSESLINTDDKPMDVADTQLEDRQLFDESLDDNYTLQVMTLSKEQSIKDFLKKHQDLGDGFSYIKISVKGKERFVLFYGSFTSSELAKKAKQALPAEFKHSLIKKMSELKK
ncbi:MAG: ATP-binding protein [Methylococcaceae bacterium]